MDIVYVVKPQRDNEELRYSLRSLKNLPHGKVFMAGYRPPWATNVHHIYRDQAGQTKYLNSRLNRQAACLDTRVSDDFILFNDDFFVMKPMKDVPTLHWGALSTVLKHYKEVSNGQAGYYKGMSQTRDLLKRLGITRPKSYELHVPMVFNKEKHLALTELIQEMNPDGYNVHFRTLYGNYYQVGGKRTKDVKVYANDQPIPQGPFLSTQDFVFYRGKVGRHIRMRFPTPCEYEL